MSRENLSLGFCDPVRLKPVCSASETSQSLEIFEIVSRDIMLSRQRTIKVLIRLICAFVVRIRHKPVFSWRGSNMKQQSSRSLRKSHPQHFPHTTWISISHCIAPYPPFFSWSGWIAGGEQGAVVTKDWCINPCRHRGLLWRNRSSSFYF